MQFIKRTLITIMTLSIVCSFIACDSNKTETTDSTGSNLIMNDNNHQNDNSSEPVSSPEYNFDTSLLSTISNALVNEYGKIDDLRKTENFAAYSCYVDGKIFISSDLEASLDSWYYYNIGANKKILTSTTLGGTFVNEDGSLTAFIPRNPTITNEKDNIIFINLPYTEDQYVTGFAPYYYFYYVIYEDNGQLYYAMFDEMGNITETGVPSGSENDKDFIELSNVQITHNGYICTTVNGDCYFSPLDMLTQEVVVDSKDGDYEEHYSHAFSLYKNQGVVREVDKVLNVVTTGKYVTKRNDSSAIYYYGNASLLSSEEPEWTITLPEGKNTNDIVFFDGQILVFSDLTCYKASSSFQEFEASSTVSSAIQEYGLDNMVIDTRGTDVMFILNGQIYELSGLY